MKRLNYIFVTFLLMSVTVIGQTLNPITQWGFIGNGGATRTGGGWSFEPSTTPGNAGVVGTKPLETWAAIKGGFDPITLSANQTIVVTGKIQFVGSGPIVWSGLRYGLFNVLTPGELQNAGTATAAWSGTEAANGYMITPHSGVTDLVSWVDGGNGTHGVVRGGAWLSTFGNAHRSLGVISQKPARAEMVAGTYNFAISVRRLANNTNELTFYIVKDDNKYWTGGTSIDNEGITATFNSVCFAVQGSPTATNADMRAMRVMDVKVGLGNPVVVPEAPWVDYYVEDWGFIGNKGATRTAGWDFAPGEVYGNAGVKGNQPLNGWSAIRGQFKEPITPTTAKALIVTGKITFVGSGPIVWSGLRYGIFMHDSAGVLKDTNKATAYWTGKESDAKGYMITPQSGTNDKVSWVVGGNGSIGVIRGGAWLSTFGNSHRSLGHVNQAPARAEMGAGTYNFAISVRPLGNGTNEIKWYIIKTDNSYWSGGTAIDDEMITTQYNGVCFAIQGSATSTNAAMREMKLEDVKLSMGNPITIPDPPFKSYYIDTWGFIGNRTNGWTLTPGDVIGNFSLSGSTPPYGFVAVRGGFDYPVTPTTDKAIIITGQMEFVGGGFDLANSLRYGLFFTENPGTLANKVWSTSENNTSGYLFLPPSGKNGAAEWWTNKYGSYGAVVNGTWLIQTGQNNYPLSSQLQLPQNAVAGEGKYDFAISIQPKSGGMEIKHFLIKTDKSYYWAGTITDTKSPLPVSKFNSVNFAFFPNRATALNFYDVKVDLGNPITVPTYTSVDDNADGLPTEFALNQNYPNPFNPTTTIEFALPKSSEVSLVIYDVLGRVVKEIVSGTYEAGNHKVIFNATNMASGIYFYKLKAGDFVSVKKLTLLK